MAAGGLRVDGAGTAGGEAGGAVASRPGGGLVDSPEYLSWAKCKPGTRIVYKKVSSGAEKPPAPAPAEITVEVTLVSVTKEKVTVRISPKMVVNGKEMPLPGGEQVIPAKTAAEAAGLPEGMPKGKMSNLKVGEETVQVGGKSYKGESREFDYQVEGPNGATGPSMHMRVVTSEDVPNCVLKSEETVKVPEGGEEMTLVAIEQP